VATILFGDTGGAADINLAFAGNVALSGTRVIAEGAGDDSLACDWNWPTGANLVHRWKMDEGAGNAVDDTADMDLSVPAWQGTGWLGSDSAALSGNYCPANSTAEWAGSDEEGCVEGWFYPTFDVSTWVGGEGAGLFLQEFAVNNGYDIGLYHGWGSYKYMVRSGGATTFNVNANVADFLVNTWHHIAICYSLTNNTFKFYIDGTQKVGTTFTASVDNTLAYFRVGYSSFFAGAFDSGQVDGVAIHAEPHYTANFSPHRYEQGNSVIQYNFGAAQSLTNIAWNATETGDWEGDISKIEVYDQDLTAWVQKGGASPTSPIDLSGSPVTIGSAALADIIRVTVDPKSDTLQSETAKLLDMTLTHSAAAGGFASPFGGTLIRGSASVGHGRGGLIRRVA